MSEPIISPSEFAKEPPKRIMRPCDWGLLNACHNLEAQLGTVEAYNRLVMAAEKMKQMIEDGHVKQANPWADPKYMMDLRNASPTTESLPPQGGAE